jgi:hypothetical protein
MVHDVEKMLLLILLFIVSCFASASDISDVKEFLNVGSTIKEHLSDTPSHRLSGVESFSLTFLDRPTTDRQLNSRRKPPSSATTTEAPYGTKLKLSFNIVGHISKTYNGLVLDLHEDLLSTKATYTSFGNQGSSRKDIISNYAYKGSLRDENGEGPELGWVRATIVNENEAYLYILNYIEGDLVVVEPADAALKHSPEARRLSSLGHRMVAYRHYKDASTNHKRSSNSFHRMRALIQNHAHRNIQTVHTKSRYLALMPAWLRNSIGTYRGAYGRMSGTQSGVTVACPAIQQMMKIGIATDAGFYQAIAGSSTSNTINDHKGKLIVIKPKK